MLSSFLDAVTPVSEWVSQWVGQWVTVSGVMLSHLRALLILMSRQFWYVKETKQADKLSCNCHLSFLEARRYQGEQLSSEENTLAGRFNIIPFPNIGLSGWVSRSVGESEFLRKFHRPASYLATLLFVSAGDEKWFIDVSSHCRQAV